MSVKKKILLIESPFNRLHHEAYAIVKYPLSLGYLAGAISKNTDWKVNVYNADFHPKPESVSLEFLVNKAHENYLSNLKDLNGVVWKEVRSVLKKYNPDVVGITAKSQNFISGTIVAKIAKQLNKDVIIVMGGPHPTLMPKKILINPEIDIAVKGEGEETMVELLHAIENHESLTAIDGIAFKNKDEIIENGRREFISNLDQLRFPYYDAEKILHDYDKYPLSAFKAIFATRGCPFGCTFCGSKYIWSRTVRFRSAANVIEEIKFLKKMGLLEVHFDDDTFGISREYIKELCEGMIKECPGMMFTCEIHPKLVNDENISLMRKAGCTHIYLGVESGSNEILKAVNKNTTIEETLLASELIRKYGIILSCFFMVGFPQETEESLLATRDAIKKADAQHILYSIFCPYPGTELYELCKTKGLIHDDFDVTLYNHQSPENCFYTDISKQRFKEITSEIVEIIDVKNRKGDFKQLFTFRTFKKISEIGVIKSLKKGFSLVLNK